MFAALALADPFLRPRDTVAVLRRAGITGITNFPTMQIVDGNTARAFDSAGVRTSREIEMLETFAAEGFRTIGFCRRRRWGARDGPHAPAMIVLHPGVALADWRQRAAAGRVRAEAGRSDPGPSGMSAAGLSAGRFRDRTRPGRRGRPMARSASRARADST